MWLELKEFKVDERTAAKKLPFPLQAACSEYSYRVYTFQQGLL